MQKTSFFKRMMTLFLAFIMLLGILPLSNMVVPAQASAGESGGPPATITLQTWQLKPAYQSKNLVPARTTPRLFQFNVNGTLSPGFCANHEKDINLVKGETWKDPVPIEETKYAVIAPLVAQYNYIWFTSRALDEQYGDSKTDAEKMQIAKEQYDCEYWGEWSGILGSAMVQSASWLVGNGKLTDLTDPAQARMIAEERNATVKSMTGKPSPDSDEEVMSWVTGAVDRYAEGGYGDWDIYLYTPAGGSHLQPIITTVPSDITVEPKTGWIKIKKTDMSGNALAGATFGIYDDANCQVLLDQFTTTADEWTYKDVSKIITTNNQVLYLKEISAPPGYMANTKVYQVTVNYTNNATQETAAPVNGGAPIKNGDSTMPPEGVVNKVDPDGNGVGPATFHFVSLTNGVETDRVTDENGTLELQWTDPTGDNYLEPGEYTVTEKIAPPGFELNTEAQNLRLWIEDVDGVPTPMHSGPITFENKPLHSIIIQKVDESGQGLPGAVFNVYLNGAKVDSITTGPDGTFTYAGTDGNGLQSGTWGFEEVQAPDGYLLPYNKYQSVTIDAINDDVRVHQLTFVNYTYPEIVIKKVSAGEEQPLAGAVFEVMIDGTNIGTYGPTGPDGTITPLILRAKP